MDDKTECVYFIKKFFGYSLKEKNVEKYDRKFIEELGFKVRQSDVIYKIKNKETLILIEIQSTINYRMPERIIKYCVCIIKSRLKSKGKFRKTSTVFPVVLSVANKVWDASLTVVQEKDEYYGFPPLEYPKYNLVDVQRLTDEELLKDRMGLSLAMLIEKQKTDEDIMKIFDFTIRRGLNIYERKAMLLMAKHSKIVTELLGDKLKKYEELIIKKAGVKMSNFERIVSKILEDKKTEGVTQGIMQVAKEMIKNKMKDEDILKVTHITKKELDNLKLQTI